MRNNEITLPEATDKKPGKLFIIISYVIALASLIAMLFVPLFDGKMLIQYVFVAVEPILTLFKVSIPDSLYGTFFINPSTLLNPTNLETGIMLTLIYVSVILALIMLIPVIAGKAAKGTNLRCAFAAEYIAFIFILAYVAYEVYLLNTASMVLGGVYIDWTNFSMLIPLGVIALVMAAQSIKYKGGLGVAKFIIFLLSLVTLFALFDIVAIIPALEKPLTDISGIIGAYNADVTFIGANFMAIIPFVELCEGTLTFAGFDNIPLLINQIISLALPMLLMVSIFLDTIGLIAGSKTKKNGEPNPHKGWFVIAAIRYSLIIVLIAAAVVLSFFLDGFGKVGIYMYFTAVLVLLTFIVEIIRYCVGKSKVKAYKREQDTLFKNETIIIKDDALTEAPAEEVPVEEEVTQVAQTAETVEEQTNIFGDQPVVEAETVEETAVEEPAESFGQQLTIMDAQTVETEVKAQPVEEVVDAEEVTAEPVEEVIEPVVVPVVEETDTQPVTEDNGFNLFGETQTAQETVSIDPFVDKLTDEERAQFFDVFINRNKGKFSSIPVYQLNGNNSDFFPSVFVHINRMRNLCSDSLLAKIYKEIGND
ncbi:MAG: hypothetical protein ACI4MQ_00670 [Candidatus Coproplasma sp.]